MVGPIHDNRTIPGRPHREFRSWSDGGWSWWDEREERGGGLEFLAVCWSLAMRETRNKNQERLTSHFTQIYFEQTKTDFQDGANL